MSRAARIAGLAVCALLAGACGSGATHTTHTTPAPARTGVVGCTTRVTASRPLTGVPQASTHVGGPPFGEAASSDAGAAFAVVDTVVGGQVDVLAGHGIHLRIAHRVALQGGLAQGAALTPDGRYLVVTDQLGAQVVDTRRARHGAPGADLGALTTPNAQLDGPIQVAISPNGRYAFVSIEDSARIAVFDLATALRTHFRDPGFVGTIPVAAYPVGLAVAPDGHWLYATSEGAPRDNRPVPDGELTVIDLRRATRDPRRSVTARVAAGCEPVRVATSPDGSRVWVTARASDALLEFSAARLTNDPAHALMHAVAVGEEPVGLAVLDAGRRIVIGDSDRFSTPGAHSALTVVDSASGAPTVLGTLPAGAFPRDMASAPGGRLLVSDFRSDRLQAIDIAALGHAG